MIPIKFDDGTIVFAEKINAFWFSEYGAKDPKDKATCFVHILLSGNELTKKVESKEYFEKTVMHALGYIV